MKLNNNLMVVITIFLILIIFINIFVIFNFESYLTGKVTRAGYVNITILTAININLTRDSINWSSGAVNIGEKNATLYTRGDNAGIVARGNWSGTNAQAFIVENIGSINCSIRLQTTKNAHDFFNSSTNSNEQYMWNVSNKELNSCSGEVILGNWTDVNKTSGGTEFCKQFNNQQSNNEIYVDILLTVPYDTQNTGEQSDILTVFADASG